MEDYGLTTQVARLIWSQRYRHGGTAEADIHATWQRVARALAAAEPREQPIWAGRFESILRNFHFLPGGRIMAGAGTPHRVTLLNCFVMGEIEDSIPGIFRALQEGAITMQQGGGVGYDFSTLRPHGVAARAAGGIASGPVSFMNVWDAMCATIQSTGARRGAMMATLHCGHPDIGMFIAAKSAPNILTHFNLSVLVTDDFMHAANADAPWKLRFPHVAPFLAEREVQAASLWNDLMRSSFITGEPGVLFIDRINKMNNLHYCEQISATNPCGEAPLPPYGACDLGSFNLTALVRNPFTPQARLDEDELDRIVPIATRMLDNVLDITQYPLPRQREEALAKRRIGLGITGLADALIMLGLQYGEDNAVAFAARIMRRICHLAYQTSVSLAQEKGCFPAYRRDAYLAAPFIRALPEALRDAISRDGIRNSHLLAIAPTGTISLLAGNISSGAEPVFAADATRTILDAMRQRQTIPVTSHAVRLWRETHGTGTLPPAFVTATQLAPAKHLVMQAALQTHIDQAIAKTINLAPGISFDEFSGIYRQAHALGLKGCTAFPSRESRGSIITSVLK